MEVWGWILGYAVLFAVVQLAIYVYYVRRGEGTPSASGVGDAEDVKRVGDRLERDPLDDGEFPEPEQSTDATEDPGTRSCPHCGTPNETVDTVKYCRHCTRSLG